MKTFFSRTTSKLMCTSWQLRSTELRYLKGLTKQVYTKCSPYGARVFECKNVKIEPLEWKLNENTHVCNFNATHRNKNHSCWLITCMYIILYNWTVASHRDHLCNVAPTDSDTLHNKLMVQFGYIDISCLISVQVIAGQTFLRFENRYAALKFFPPFDIF